MNSVSIHPTNSSILALTTGDRKSINQTTNDHQQSRDKPSSRNSEEMKEDRVEKEDVEEEEEKSAPTISSLLLVFKV